MVKFSYKSDYVIKVTDLSSSPRRRHPFRNLSTTCIVSSKLKVIPRAMAILKNEKKQRSQGKFFITSKCTKKKPGYGARARLGMKFICGKTLMNWKWRSANVSFKAS